MSAGAERLAAAERAQDPVEADRLAVQAILAEPSLAGAYGLRGRIAARRGDAVTAAHHFRAAWARGDRSVETRAAMAICFEAAGQPASVDAMGAPADLPASLEGFAESARLMAPAIRGMLALPLPPPNEPALLPGEQRDSGLVEVEPRNTAGAGVIVARRLSGRSAPPSGPRRSTSAPPSSAPPSRPTAPRAAPSRPPARAPAPAISMPPGPVGSDWLETSHTLRTAAVDTQRGSWVDDEAIIMPADSGGPRFTGGHVDLVVNPGLPEAPVRSPVTGRIISPAEFQHALDGAMMPAFNPLEATPASAPAVGVPSPMLEARDDFDASVAGLRLALFLPGPVITGPNQRPQQLSRSVALGLTRDELLFRDRLRPDSAPVRLPLRALARMDVLREGAQVSLALSDGRQLHLDLRELHGRAPSLAQVLVAELAASLEALGAAVRR